MENLPEGLSGGIGVIFGAIATWIGFKDRLKSHDQRLEVVETIMVTESTCEERAKGCSTQFADIKDMLAEIRSDVKQLHVRSRMEGRGRG